MNRNILSSLLLIFFLSIGGALQAQGGDQLLKLGSSDDEEKDMPLTTISFAEPVYNFDTLTAGDSIRFSFEFTNTGDYDLMLERVKPSCSCATLDWPQGIIKPGKSGAIKVVIDTDDKSGEQHKYIHVFYNGIPDVETLKIEGFIRPKPEE